MIIKEHLTEFMYDHKVPLHNCAFYSKRTHICQRPSYEKTYKGGETLNLLPFFVDYLYPLRVICKNLDSILREKITKDHNGDLQVSM